MTMKETVRSLKLYFILCGIVGLLPVIGQISQASANVFLGVFGLISLAFAVAYFYIGVSLQKLIVTSPNMIVNVLYANAAYSLLVFLLSLLSGFNPAAAGITAFSLLVLWYLLVNVKRLAQEDKERLQEETPQ